MSNSVRHTVYTVLIVAGAIVAALAKQEPDWAPILGVLSAVLGAVLQIFTDSPTTAAKMARLTTALGSAQADQVIRGVGTGPQRGFSSVRALLVVVALGSTAWLGAWAIIGCSGAGVTPQTATDIQIGLDAAVCIIGNGAADLAAGMSPAQIIPDLVHKCGASAAQIATIFDSQAAAADKGLTPAQTRALIAAARSTDGGK